MKKQIATLNCSLDITCPECKNRFDLFDEDDESIYSKPIFNNDWDKLNDVDAECPKCYYLFQIETVEY